MDLCHFGQGWSLGFMQQTCLRNLTELFEVMKMIDEGRAAKIVNLDFVTHLTKFLMVG